MKAKGLLFKPEMIRALLNTKPRTYPAKPIDATKPYKGQTRRMIKSQQRVGQKTIIYSTCPYPQGTIIYAKETHWVDSREPKELVIYETPRADGLLQARYRTAKHIETCEAALNIEYLEKHKFWRRRPSIFLPKWASRLWFKVMRVRVERVNVITEQDAKQEGVTCPERGEKCTGFAPPANTSLPPEECQCIDGYVPLYKTLWDSINGKGSFDRGPWVWVYDLRRLSEKELERLRAQE